MLPTYKPVFIIRRVQRALVDITAQAITVSIVVLVFWTFVNFKFFALNFIQGETPVQIPQFGGCRSRVASC